MRHRLTVAMIAAAAVAGGLGAPARAQAVCGERAEILGTLENVYAEMPRAIGLTADGAVIEILAAPSGSWTMLLTYPNRPTCVLSAGEAWENFPVLAIDRPA